LKREQRKKSLKYFSQTLVRKKNLITFATPKQQREDKKKRTTVHFKNEIRESIAFKNRRYGQHNNG